jgi:hypothetical protein
MAYFHNRQAQGMGWKKRIFFVYLVPSILYPFYNLKTFSALRW